MIEPIVMPKWGLAMQEGMVAEWQIEPGAEIAAGQEIMDIETSKIANVYESPVAGTFRRIVVEAGQTVPVGALLGVVAPASVTDDEVEAYVKDFNDNFDWDAAAGDTGPEPETVDAGGTRLRYLKMGDAAGIPLVFIHGYGGDLYSWMFNQGDLSEGRTTYAIDLPGHGGSSKEVGAGDLGVFTSAVLAFMDAKSIDKAHLVGHSMGGATALSLAVDAGDRVASATLIAPAGLGSEINMDYINGFIEQKRAKKLRGVLEMLVADPGAITSEMVEEVIKFKRVDGVGPALEKLRDGLMPGEQAQEGAKILKRAAFIADTCSIVPDLPVDPVFLARGVACFARTDPQHHRRPERLELGGHEPGDGARVHFLGQAMPFVFAQQVRQGLAFDNEHDRRIIREIALQLRLVRIRNLEVDQRGLIDQGLQRIQMSGGSGMFKMIRPEEGDPGIAPAGLPQETIGIGGGIGPLRQGLFPVCGKRGNQVLAIAAGNSGKGQNQQK